MDDVSARDNKKIKLLKSFILNIVRITIKNYVFWAHSYEKIQYDDTSCFDFSNLYWILSTSAKLN